MSRVVNDVGEIIQPEEVPLMFMELSDNEQFTNKSNRQFSIICVIIVLILFTVKFAYVDHIPKVFEAIASIFISTSSVGLVFILINQFNKKIIRYKFNAFFILILAIVAIIILTGALI